MSPSKTPLPSSGPSEVPWPGTNLSLRARSGEVIEVRGASVPGAADVLTREAMEFIAVLATRFESRRRQLLADRPAFRRHLVEGRPPEFPPETREIRERRWQVADPPADLRDRRVEITGPVDRKMIINALNSGAQVYMADFEDAHSPTWAGTIDGQRNLAAAVRRRISYDSPEGRQYRLADQTAVLMTRPRGWHLVERHFRVNGEPVSASLFDFGLFFFHNASELLARGSGPYFYLPKIEHYREARLWNDVFGAAQEMLGLPRGKVRATVLIETLPAAFQMDEILWELREHSAGLNCGRWDYIFSFIKQFSEDRTLIFPDRARLPMTTPFLDAYARLLVHTCHKRKAHAMGGMAAQIPIRNDPVANEAALALVVADKEREVALGHDGTWVAHPGLVPIARKVFDARMPGPNQIERPLGPDSVHVDDLLARPAGPVTREGLRRNARVALRYLEAWFRGVGCVPIDHLMEDAATVEIARAQVWQWVHHGARFDGGGPVEVASFREVLTDEARVLGQESPGAGTEERIQRAVRLLSDIVADPTFTEFLTVGAYAQLEGERPVDRLD